MHRSQGRAPDWELPDACRLPASSVMHLHVHSTLLLSLASAGLVWSGAKANQPRLSSPPAIPMPDLRVKLHA
ncbi:hypothetical protein C8R46DRAFT_1223447 [Mycena filopes]|nr:hypothetical protein C8R46DRAFT_1223447 [Mycena filopes]